MSACPHTDNADKCTCGPGCGCPGMESEDAFAARVIGEARAKAGVDDAGPMPSSMDFAMVRQASVYVPDGPEIVVWPAPAELGPGLMLRMVMPEDGREVQAYLPIDSADHLAELLVNPALRRPDPDDVRPTDGPWVSWGGDGVGP